MQTLNEQISGGMSVYDLLKPGEAHAAHGRMKFLIDAHLPCRLAYLPGQSMRIIELISFTASELGSSGIS
jgi:hypothetical protein